MIDITGLDKAEVLQVLYNNSKVQGMGFLHATGTDMTVAEARALLDCYADFDYLHGKVMKVNLTSDFGFEEWGYDRDNGPGAARSAIQTLRVKKVVAQAEIPITGLAEFINELCMNGYTLKFERQERFGSVIITMSKSNHNRSSSMGYKILKDLNCADIELLSRLQYIKNELDSYQEG